MFSSISLLWLFVIVDKHQSNWSRYTTISINGSADPCKLIFHLSVRLEKPTFLNYVFAAIPSLVLVWPKPCVRYHVSCFFHFFGFVRTWETYIPLQLTQHLEDYFWPKTKVSICACTTNLGTPVIICWLSCATTTMYVFQNCQLTSCGFRKLHFIANLIFSI